MPARMRSRVNPSHTDPAGACTKPGRRSPDRIPQLLRASESERATPPRHERHVSPPQFKSQPPGPSMPILSDRRLSFLPFPAASCRGVLPIISKRQLPVAVTRFRPGTAVTAHLLVAGRMRD